MIKESIKEYYGEICLGIILLGQLIGLGVGVVSGECAGLYIGQGALVLGGLMLAPVVYINLRVEMDRKRRIDQHRQRIHVHRRSEAKDASEETGD